MAPTVEKLERALAQWTEYQKPRATPLSNKSIQAKAKILFDNLNPTDPDSKGNPLLAVMGDFQSLKGCHGFHNPQLKGEDAGAN
jgi:phospholipase C